MNGEIPHADDLCQRAELYAAGALPAEQAREFEQHLSGGCPACGAAMRALDPVLVELYGMVEAQPVPADVRSRVMARVEADAAVPSPQVWKNWAGDNSAVDLFTLRANEGEWSETGATGVSIKRLFVDRTRNEMTALIRMSPGASYPRHVHDGPEQCLVLQGDLHVGDLVMHAGDYQRAGPGSKHVEQRTEAGCLLLITSSLSDEMY